MSHAQPALPRGRIAIVEQLRGLAAFAVLWFHLTAGNPRFLDDGPLLWSGLYGWLGVHVFFVISGFIIPYAMYRARYRAPEHMPPFLAKRLLRLEPPYLMTIALCVLLGYVSTWVPGYRGGPPDFQPMQIVLHLGYLVGFTDYLWVNPVFWSLAIEFQYYIAMAMLFPLIANERAWIRHATLALLVGSSFLPLPEVFVTRYLAQFALGVVTFYFWAGWLERRSFLLAASLIGTVVIFFDMRFVGVACLGTALLLAFVRGEGFKPLVWLGTISYSLYLIHTPIGGRIINLGERLGAEGPLRIGVLLVGIVVSLSAAYLFYRFVERPAQRWSARIRYGEREAAAVTSPPVVEAV